MDSAWLDEYIAAWSNHVRAGGPDGATELEELLRHMTPDVTYVDVPSGFRYAGHDGVREMAKMAHGVSPDMSFEIVSRQCDGSGFAFEWVCSGHIGDRPEPFTFHAASVGSLSADGLVQSHSDYWDLGGLRP